MIYRPHFTYIGGLVIGGGLGKPMGIGGLTGAGLLSSGLTIGLGGFSS